MPRGSSFMRSLTILAILCAPLATPKRFIGWSPTNSKDKLDQDWRKIGWSRLLHLEIAELAAAGQVVGARS
jgi:hypothetical protein